MDEWNFAELWNSSLNFQPRTEFQPRDRIWASELYNAPVDLYLKMKGTNPSNVPDMRSLLKFNAGNKTEMIFRAMLVMMGIFKKSQTRVTLDKPGLIQVSGKVDFEAGGGLPVVNEQLMEVLEILGISDEDREQAKFMVENIIRLHPNGISAKIIEVKSVASFGMNRILATQQAIEGHELQAFHYAYNTGKTVELLYVCRDDWRVWGKNIEPNDPAIMKKYFEKIEEITRNFNLNIQPPKEKLILYDELTGKFSRNFSVQYSSYLTMLYGFKHAEEYAGWFKSATRDWNKATGWVAKGKRVTPKKDEILKQIEAAGFSVPSIIKKLTELAAKGIAIPEEEAEE